MYMYVTIRDRQGSTRTAPLLPYTTRFRAHSRHKYVAGAAAYADGLPEPQGLLHLCLGLSSVAHAGVRRLDLDAVGAAPGVALVLTAADIPGVNDISPTHRHDEPILAEDKIGRAHV